MNTQHRILTAAILALGLAACGQTEQAAAPAASTPEPAAAAAPPATTAAGPMVTNLTASLPPSGATVAGGYLTITGGAEADRLVGAASPVAARMELHEMAMVDNMMTMRPVPAIDVPAGGTVELKRGGLHLMFIDLKQPLSDGQLVPVTLTFEKAGPMEVQLKVTPAPSSEHGEGEHGKGEDEHAGHER
jgi:periplasmic copper chaperone A